MQRHVTLGLALFALAGCDEGHEVDAVDAAPPKPKVAPPPMELIFEVIELQKDVNGDGQLDGQDHDASGMPILETRYFFNDAYLTSVCLIPDQDSFDDYENVELGIGRGTTPLATGCRADGIVTGPLHDELYPSKWCNKPSCVPQQALED
jgi:hypothetical protein